MAKVSYENFDASAESNAADVGATPRVSFFALKDGEEAVIRIMCDSTDDFDIRTVHNIVMDGFQYGRKMNCLRASISDPVDSCPLCAAGNPVYQKIYIKLIQYTTNENGQVVATPKIWERGVADRGFGARALKAYMDNYGPLSDMVCKVIRKGQKLDTEYTFIPMLSPQVYRPDIYLKDETLFNNYSPLGFAILDKNADEYNEFLATGKFPERKPRSESQTQNTPYSAGNTYADNSPRPTTNPGVTANFNPEPVTTNATAAPAFGNNPAPSNMPWNNSAPSAFDRPRRY